MKNKKNENTFYLFIKVNSNGTNILILLTDNLLTICFIGYIIL